MLGSGGKAEPKTELISKETGANSNKLASSAVHSEVLKHSTPEGKTELSKLETSIKDSLTPHINVQKPTENAKSTITANPAGIVPEHRSIVDTAKSTESPKLNATPDQKSVKTKMFYSAYWQEAINNLTSRKVFAASLKYISYAVLVILIGFILYIICFLICLKGKSGKKEKDGDQVCYNISDYEDELKSINRNKAGSQYFN